MGLCPARAHSITLDRKETSGNTSRVGMYEEPLYRPLSTTNISIALMAQNRLMCPCHHQRTTRVRMASRTFG